MSEKEAPKQFSVEINGKEIKADPGQMIIEVADDNGIFIPRFCYHKKLSIAANCRMCLVDVDGARRPSPSCATPIMDGMKVYTKSKKTLSYQKAVMEFLLVNHPLDCPVCDQGGECELQDVAMSSGKMTTKFREDKNVSPDPDLGSLVSTDMTRCICCTRCVRFGEEIAGARELGATGRGDHMVIGTYINKTLDSELSGNVIDICPVGALTSKPFRFTARAWELQQRATISSHDGVGSNIYAHVRRENIMRVVPKENDELNEVWLSDRDRFSYEGINTEDRATVPMIKKQDEWEHVTWEEALAFVKVSLETVKNGAGANKIGAVASESSTLEELYLLQKLLRALGSNNIDSRLKQQDFNNNVNAGTGLNCSLKDIEDSDYILLIGSDLRKEQPIINHRVRKASINGAKIVSFNAQESDFNYEAEQVLVNYGELVHILASILKAICQRVSTDNVNAIDEIETLCNDIAVNHTVELVARSLIDSKKPVIMFGSAAVMHPDFSILYSLLARIQDVLSLKGGVLGFGANAKGALNVGAVPYNGPNGAKTAKGGANLADILTGSAELEALFLLNVEPELDTQFADIAKETLINTDIVIAVTPYASENIKEYADIIIPISSFAETSGTFVNLFGKQQSFNAVTHPKGEARPAWKVLRVIANLIGIEGFDYLSSQDVLTEILDIKEQNKQDQIEGCFLPAQLPKAQENIRLLPCFSLYGVDNIVRRASSLQATKDNKSLEGVQISMKLAQKLSLSTGDTVEVNIAGHKYELPVLLNEMLAEKTIRLASGRGVATVASSFDLIRIERLEQEVID